MLRVRTKAFTFVSLVGALATSGACRSYEYGLPNDPYRLPDAKAVAAKPAEPVRKMEVAMPGVATDEVVTVSAEPGPAVGGGVATGKAGDEDIYAYSYDEDYDGIADAKDSAGNAGGGGSPSTNDGKPAVQAEMFDVEARFTLEVDKLDEARAKVRQMTKDYGGNVISDALDAQYSNSEANFELRIPSPRIDAFLDGMNGLGKVKARDVKARDVSKEHHDAKLLLSNLELTMKRYQEILEKAKDVKEILAIETELARLRTQIDQVKGNITWLEDRTARSTVYLRLVPAKPDYDLDEPEAKFFPGLRTTYLLDARGEGRKDKFIGFGLSLQFARAFTIDLDGMRQVGEGGPFDGLQAFIATMGGDFYSDYFGAGRRRWLNPYLGARIGYARILSGEQRLNDFAATGVIGLELYKTKTFLIDLQFRLHGFFGNKQGAHVGMQPSAGFNFAF